MLKHDMCSPTLMQDCLHMCSLDETLLVVLFKVSISLLIFVLSFIFLKDYLFGSKRA